MIAVRLADSIPAFLFGLHGGLAADRFSRKRLMVSADLVRAFVLVPVAIAGLAGGLPLWGARRRVVRARVGDKLLRARLRRHDPGARRPPERAARERARAVDDAGPLDRRLGGRRRLLTFMPMSVFFGVNAASFFVSAALLTGLRHGGEHDPHGEAPSFAQAWRRYSRGRC